MRPLHQPRRILCGIPTAISYDMVKAGDCYGSVYELLDAQEFLTILENDKAHLDAHIQKFARAIRAMHRIEVDPARFPPAKAGSLAAIHMLSPDRIETMKRTALDYVDGGMEPLCF